VVDFRAFVNDLRTDFMSMEHTPARLLKLRSAAGDRLVTNKRRILTLSEDPSAGVHDKAHFAVPA
jgi:uncharacterized protein